MRRPTKRAEICVFRILAAKKPVSAVQLQLQYKGSLASRDRIGMRRPTKRGEICVFRILAAKKPVSAVQRQVRTKGSTACVLFLRLAYFPPPDHDPPDATSVGPGRRDHDVRRDRDWRRT